VEEQYLFNLKTKQNPQHIVSQVNELLNLVHIGLVRPCIYPLNNKTEERIMIPAEHGGQPDLHLRYETAVLGSTSF